MILAALLFAAGFFLLVSASARIFVALVEAMILAPITFVILFAFVALAYVAGGAP